MRFNVIDALVVWPAFRPTTTVRVSWFANDKVRVVAPGGRSLIVHTPATVEHDPPWFELTATPASATGVAASSWTVTVTDERFGWSASTIVVAAFASTVIVADVVAYPVLTARRLSKPTDCTLGPQLPALVVHTFVGDAGSLMLLMATPSRLAPESASMVRIVSDDVVGVAETVGN